MRINRKLTGLDLRHLIRELSSLEGRILKKVYLVKEDVFSISFHPEVEGKRELILDLRGFVFLTDLKWAKPISPPSFVMALRKHLEGKRFSEVSQLGMDRILSLSLGDKGLIVELFGRGNLILLQGCDVLLPLRKIEFSDRTVKPGEAYHRPRGPEDEFEPSDIESISKMLKKSAYDDKPLWKILAGIFGIGPPYTDEVSGKIGLDPRSPLPKNEGKLEELSRLIHLFLNRKTEPVVYLEEGNVINFSAFPLEHLSTKYGKVEVGSLSEAIQLYYKSFISYEEEDPRIKSLEVEIDRQGELKREYLERSKEYRSIGDLIYSHLSEVEDVLRRVKRGEETPSMLSIDRRLGKIVLLLDGKEVQLNLLKSAAENASDYYEKAKKFKKKCEGIDKAVISLRKKLEKLRKEFEEKSEAKMPSKRRKLRWYERFRWFYTSGSFLVIGGRDSQTNTEIVSKYLGDDDLFFHVDMPGGSVVVLRSEGKEPDEESILQTAIAAGSFSRAWKEGLTSVDIYYVKGSQVSLHAPPGMYLPKGSFFISGRRNYLRVKLEMCIGFQETPDGIKLTAAPPGAPLLYSICLRPGSIRKEEAAKILRDLLRRRLINVKLEEGSESSVGSVSIDDIVRAMPPGRVAIME